MRLLFQNVQWCIQNYNIDNNNNWSHKPSNSWNVCNSDRNTIIESCDQYDVLGNPNQSCCIFLSFPTSISAGESVNKAINVKVCAANRMNYPRSQIDAFPYSKIILLYLYLFFVLVRCLFFIWSVNFCFLSIFIFTYTLLLRWHVLIYLSFCWHNCFFLNIHWLQHRSAIRTNVLRFLVE